MEGIFSTGAFMLWSYTGYSYSFDKRAFSKGEYLGFYYAGAIGAKAAPPNLPDTCLRDCVEGSASL